MTVTRAARPKAFVTGASRGIGKGIALSLAKGGFDLAITARTVEEGEQREHSSTVHKSDTSPLPGSLNSTAELLRAAGAEVMVVPADLIDRASLGAAAATVLERWGGVDLVVHNARFIGPGHMDLTLDTPVDVLEKHVQGNAHAPLVLNHYFEPAMLIRGAGTVIYITSSAAYQAPPSKVGQGRLGSELFDVQGRRPRHRRSAGGRIWRPGDPRFQRPARPGQDRAAAAGHGRFWV